MTRCAVYVVSNAPFGMVKVGISNQPSNRLASFCKSWLKTFMAAERHALGLVDPDAAVGAYYECRYPTLELELWLPSRDSALSVEALAHGLLGKASGAKPHVDCDGATEMFSVPAQVAVLCVVESYAQFWRDFAASRRPPAISSRNALAPCTAAGGVLSRSFARAKARGGIK